MKLFNIVHIEKGAFDCLIKVTTQYTANSMFSALEIAMGEGKEVVSITEITITPVKVAS